MRIIRQIRNSALALIAVTAASVTLSSCEDIYDYQGDCTVHYRLQFVYDMNLKWADAFPSEVKSVNVYAFDRNGVFVRNFVDSGDALSQPGYSMELDLPAGSYQLLAWCGMNNPGVVEQSFTVPQPVPGVTTIDELTCTLNTLSNTEYPVYSNTMLNFLYYGSLQVDLPNPQDGSTHYYTMPLIKDTNHIRIILQQLSADDMEEDDFIITISAPNARMASNNSLLPSPEVTYLPWWTQLATAGVGKPDASGGTQIVQVDGVMADFTVGRMTTGQSTDMMLTIIDADDPTNVIASVPIIQYSLLAKNYYEAAYGHQMTDQEFLDREDEYVLTFFLDRNFRWISTSILIHSWRIVLGDYGLGNE